MAHLGLVLPSTAAFGQGTASIVGTVTDPTGAAVPNAKITITDMDTGFIRTTTTNTQATTAPANFPSDTTNFGGGRRASKHTSKTTSL